MGLFSFQSVRPLLSLLVFAGMHCKVLGVMYRLLIKQICADNQKLEEWTPTVLSPSVAASEGLHSAFRASGVPPDDLSCPGSYPYALDTHHNRVDEMCLGVTVDDFRSFPFLSEAEGEMFFSGIWTPRL